MVGQINAIGASTRAGDVHLVLLRVLNATARARTQEQILNAIDVPVVLKSFENDTQVSGPGAWSHLRVDSDIVDGGETELVGLARWCGKKREKVKVLKSREN